MRWGKIAWFIILTFVVSWAMAGVYFGAGGTLASPWALAMLLPYMFVPSISALIVQGLVYREPLKGPLGLHFPLRRWPWFLFAIFLPPLLALGAFGMAVLLPGISFSPGAESYIATFRDRLTPEQLLQLQRQLTALPWPLLLAIIMVQSTLIGAVANVLPALGEELGWRGLLFRELAPWRFWPATLFTGVVWGLWHAPIIWQGYNYPQHPRVGVLMMTAFTLLFTPLISYARLRTGSVFAAALMHATLNATAGAAVIFLAGGSDLTRGVLGLAGFIVLGVLNLGLLLFDRRLLHVPMVALMHEEEQQSRPYRR